MSSGIRKALAASLLAVALIVGGVAASASASTTASVGTSASASPAREWAGSVVVQPQVAYAWTVHSGGFWNYYTCSAYAFGIMRTHPEYRDYKCLETADGTWEFWVYAPDGYN